MFFSDHPSDKDLLLAADRELSARSARRVEAHLAACSACRERMDAIESGLADFVRLHQQTLNPLLPPSEDSRAALKAQLAASHHSGPGLHRLAYVAAALLLIPLGLVMSRRATPHLTVPRSSLTPGATRGVTREEVCATPSQSVRILPAVQRKVFEKYGLEHADTQAYEVDYLITPELGGADDIRNLWPQPYSATVWNAHVKDALEDRLHGMVCSGELDLATAQHDIATDWIAAYKKYFHSDRPLNR